METLKTALCYFISDCDLPYAIVNRKSFKDLLLLVNSQTSGMLVQRHAMAQHCSKVYNHYKNFIQSEYFDKSDYVALTQDAWTSPNHHGFLGITSHFITQDWKLMDVIIGMPHIEGKSFPIFCCMLFFQIAN